MTRVCKKDLKEFDLNNQIYILDPLDLELYHIYSPLDIERLYESVIMPKRNSVKISSSYNFDKSSRKIDVVSLDISHGCTLKCSYCYLSAGYHKKEMMSFLLITKMSISDITAAAKTAFAPIRFIQNATRKIPSITP